MVNELVSASIGVTAGLGGLVILTRFLNKKIDTAITKTDNAMKCKQSIKLCDERSGDIQKDLERGEAKFDKIMKIQTDMLISIEGLTKEIKHFNNSK